MLKKSNNNAGIPDISNAYFEYLAKNHPVMCSSDEFYFFPRVRRSVDYLDLLDDLDEQKIKEDISQVKRLKDLLEKSCCTENIEDEIDASLLKQSMFLFLQQFDTLKIWQKDPTIYLKIALLSVYQITSNLNFMCADTKMCLIKRLNGFPALFRIAQNNLKKIPEIYLEVGLQSVSHSRKYLQYIMPDTKRDYPLKEAIGIAAASLEEFENFLRKHASYKTDLLGDKQELMSMIKNGYAYDKSVEEIFDMASRDYESAIKELRNTIEYIDVDRYWKTILSGAHISRRAPDKLLKLYSDEIKKQKQFLVENNIITIPKTQNIKVRFTPFFMRPIRASASYSSPITNSKKEPAYFYVTNGMGGSCGNAKSKIIYDMHNEYKFITAHETYPGHHLLDSIRRSLQNPIRAEIESPIFYEGWASYSETIMLRTGYLKDPAERLIALKRQAWRAARAMIDVGIRIRRLGLKEAITLLEALGYDHRTSKKMINRYLLSAGYQLCYTIGKLEIDKLRKRFSSGLGLKKFHDTLLENGEIPFRFVQKILNSKKCNKNS